MSQPPVHPDLQDRLVRDGYTLVENFLAPSEIDYLMKVFRSLDCPSHHGGWTASIYSRDLAYRAEVERVIRSVFTSRAATLLPGYRFTVCNYLIKEPQQNQAAGVVQIHQDPTFVDEERYDSMGIWVPLVDTDATNGAITVLPGSHRWNRGPRSFGGAASPYLNILPALVEHAQPLPMKAGTAMVFSQKVFHGSPTNMSKATRVSVAALLVQNEAQLRCYYANPKLPGKLEVFAVDDDFYPRYIYATRPEGVPRMAVVDHWHEPVRLEQIAATVASTRGFRESRPSL